MKDKDETIKILTREANVVDESLKPFHLSAQNLNSLLLKRKFDKHYSGIKIEKKKIHNDLTEQLKAPNDKMNIFKICGIQHMKGKICKNI